MSGAADFPVPRDEAEREACIDALLGSLELEEKVFMLSGHGFFEAIREDGGRYCARVYHIGAGNERLGVPKLLFNDGPRGVAAGSSTCFPVSMARGASFDVDLERRVGEAVARELRAQGGNLFGGVCINLLRHPAWGRAQETYGEDAFHLGAMGAALVEGVQRHNVVATIKHFAANSMENARFTVDVRVGERALREVYLRHFERCVAAGAGAVMSAYNRLNGAYCGHNPELLTRILKEEWGFDGFVYSDFVLGCRGADACGAGLDVEAPDTVHFGPKLMAAAEAGDVPAARIDDAVRRVLRTLLRTLAREDPEAYPAEVVACREHVALAREAATKGIVLLRNEGVLPWDAASLRRVLVLGRLAAVPNLGDHGSSRVYPPRVVTPLEGLGAALPGAEIVHDEGGDPARVAALAEGADAVLVVVGYDHEAEGEFIPGQMVDLSGDAAKSIGGDRLDLGLGEEQEGLVLAACAAHPRTVVAVMAGSAVLMEEWRAAAPGILMLWYPGMDGGSALADVLLGAANPSGRLPFTVPRRAEDLPFFDREAESIEYDLWHGLAHFDRLAAEGVEPAFPFGFGLSYTDYAFAGARAARAGDETLCVGVDVANLGARSGECVVQVYAGPETPPPHTPARRLCGFTRVALAPGERRRCEVDLRLRDLARFDAQARQWRLDPGPWRVQVGASSAAADLVEVVTALPERRWDLRAR